MRRQTTLESAPNLTLGAPLPTGDPSSPSPQAATAHRARGLLGVRRTFLVDRRFQIRAALLTTGTTLLLLVLLNLSLHAVRAESAGRILAETPELEPILRSHGGLETALLIASSVIFLCGVFVITILETHKTAGAALSLRRHMDQVRRGQIHTRIRLRHDDTLRPLARSFNGMTRSIEGRLWEEVETLERFADRAERLTGPADAEGLGREIRSHADRLRRLVD